MASRSVDSAGCGRAVAAIDLDGAIDHHLWRVGLSYFEAPLVIFLTIGEKTGGVSILPTTMIPVINVFAEHDHVGARDRLRCIKFLEQGVSGRTT